MRLEQLFLQVDHFITGHSMWDCRAVISALLEILTIFSRTDLKKEILKELDRHHSVLTRISKSQGVDLAKLQHILDELDEIKSSLYATNGKIGLSLMENELFKSISQRSSIPGGTCAFDLPEYHYWLEQNDAEREKDLEDWVRPFLCIRRAIDLILKFIRESTAPTPEIAQAGFYQQSLDKRLPYQLLRISLDYGLPYFAEVSGGKHRFTIRFMAVENNNRPSQVSDDIEFELTRCIF